jgi:plasmid stability protein
MSRLATIQWASPALRKQQSLRHKGKVISDAQRLKLSVAGRGRVVGAETRAKIAAALRGKSRPEHVVAAVRAAQTGKKHSIETRTKMSLSKKGVLKSEAHRMAIRESLIRLAVERKGVPS